MAGAAAYSPEELGKSLGYRFAALSRAVFESDFTQVSFSDLSDVLRASLLEACVHIEWVGESFPSPNSPKSPTVYVTSRCVCVCALRVGALSVGGTR